jgi:polysaccharide deacetylase family sporulation protein PdaB
MRRRASRIIARNRRSFKWIAAALLLVIPISAQKPLGARTNRPGIIYWHGDPAERKVALTFDDGPNEPYTSEILSILKYYNVHATFFMMGENIEVYPDTARAIVQAGHVIGNHSYSHKDLVMDTNADVRRQIQKTDEIIQQVTGQRTHLFRPPYGSKDFLTIKQTSKLGYIMVEWTVSAKDWSKPGTPRIIANVMKRVHNGSIILLHDGDKWRHGSDRSQTVAALPTLITKLREQGYELVTVPELLKLNDIN